MTVSNLMAPRNQIVVGISDCAVSADPATTLITYALGSCVAVALHDPAAKAGALLHIILPESQLNPEKAAQNPWMFADTGIPKMVERLANSGAQPRRLTVRMAGGAQVLDPGGVFNIGKRNIMAARKALWKAGLLLGGEAVGGEVSRTVRLVLQTGAFLIREPGRDEYEMPVKGGVR